MTEESKIIQCGVVMPISAIDGCSEGHWGDVLGILTEAIEDAGFTGNLVSNADDVGIIHKRIIQNLYDNPIVVCDVSGKNPNVMFELGLRLAFDKPTIIVKDDKTSYSFDTSSIEHLEYPRDLRFSKIVEFKEKLREKLSATYKKANSDPNYTTFLKHFGEFKIAKLDQKEVSGQEFIIEELQSMRRSINRLDMRRKSSLDRLHREADIDICTGGATDNQRSEAFDFLMNHSGTRNVGMAEIDPEHFHIYADTLSRMEGIEIEHEARNILGKQKTRRRKLKEKDLSQES